MLSRPAQVCRPILAAELGHNRHERQDGLVPAVARHLDVAAVAAEVLDRANLLGAHPRHRNEQGTAIKSLNSSILRKLTQISQLDRWRVKGYPSVSSDRIVAVGLLTQANLDSFGADLRKVYPIDETPCFKELLEAIDEADREHWREQDRLEALARLRGEK
jgi:hypothetical protein